MTQNSYHRYTSKSVLRDYIQAGIGVLFFGLPVLLADLGIIMGTILGALTIFFIGHGARTLNHQLSFFDGILNRLDRPINVDHDTFAYAFAWRGADADNVDLTFGSALTHDRADLGRSDVETDENFFFSDFAHDHSLCLKI